MSLDSNLYTELPNFQAVLFKLTFLCACKAAIAWTICLAASVYASNILVSVYDSIKTIGQKIDVLSIIMVFDYVIVMHQTHEVWQVE